MDIRLLLEEMDHEFPDELEEMDHEFPELEEHWRYENETSSEEEVNQEGEAL